MNLMLGATDEEMAPLKNRVRRLTSPFFPLRPSQSSDLTTENSSTGGLERSVVQKVSP